MPPGTPPRARGSPGSKIRWNDSPFWVFRVPAEVSADHGDISSPLWGRLMLELMNRNRVFDPELELRLAGSEFID